MAYNEPLLHIEKLSRFYGEGAAQVKALDNLSFKIAQGEFVAIVGKSGSGKSTLMNILGCLDLPSAGCYLVSGNDVSQLNSNQLAALRLKTFGFVFQRYQLLPSLTAQDNVGLPAIYAGTDKTLRQQRSLALLEQLGLEDRSQHKPSELSGGQQQRVSIARALINGAEVILADEPTGALDSKSSTQVLNLLQELNRQGTTVIMITHDKSIAAAADRQIELSDGKITSDTGVPSEMKLQPTKKAKIVELPSISIKEAVSMAINALYANLFRTLLTLLGVIIGVAAVISIMAIGDGSKQTIIKSIEKMGSNLVMVRPGGPGDRRFWRTRTLKLDDAYALKNVQGVTAVAPARDEGAVIRYRNNNLRAEVIATSPSFLQVRGWSLAQGVMFSQQDMDENAAVVVIGAAVATQLFPDEDPIGKYVMMKKTLYQVIGVIKTQGASAGGNNDDEAVIVPITTAFVRLFKAKHLEHISLKTDSSYDLASVQESVRLKLLSRHGVEDFKTVNTASLQETFTETQDTLTLLLAAVASISLLVGSIGVMNIMLVSVSERRREIGLCLATGAKRIDILRQFNIEALVVCGFGGIAGILLGLLVALILMFFAVPIYIALYPAILAFTSSCIAGLVFGHMPARKASQLNPIDALSED